eukprot:860148-Rhodomonas_salina.1
MLRMGSVRGMKHRYGAQMQRKHTSGHSSDSAGHAQCRLIGFMLGVSGNRLSNHWGKYHEQQEADESSLAAC